MPDTSEPEFCRTCIEGIRIPVLLLVTACGIMVALLLPPIAQPPGYHDFADQRSLFGIPHIWNVLSNLAFVLAGGICHFLAVVWYVLPVLPAVPVSG